LPALQVPRLSLNESIALTLRFRHARGVDILRDADAIGAPSVAALQRTFTP
jgi:hypothetical protein